MQLIAVIFFVLSDIKDTLVRCCAATCSREWIHFACADPPLTTKPEGDWYCSRECETGDSSIYCICKKKGSGMMIQCSKEEQCTRHEWYHCSCIARPDDAVTPGIFNI